MKLTLKDNNEVIDIDWRDINDFRQDGEGAWLELGVLTERRVWIEVKEDMDTIHKMVGDEDA